MRVNVEFKAKCENLEEIREILSKIKANYKGKDHQVDTYFKVPKGKLKLRKGNIDSGLIAYKRDDSNGVNHTSFHVFATPEGERLEEVLTASLGVRAIVDKKRDIYSLSNLRIHLDEVEGLGSFVEVEARDLKGEIGIEALKGQCEYFKRLFNIKESDIVNEHYVDLLIRKSLLHT